MRVELLGALIECKAILACLIGEAIVKELEEDQRCHSHHVCVRFERVYISCILFALNLSHMKRLLALMMCATSLGVMGQEECNDVSSFFDFADLYLEADQYSPDSINYFLVRFFPDGVGEYWQLNPSSTSGIFSFEYNLCEENGIISYSDSFFYEGQVNANGVFVGITNDGAPFTFSPIREGFPFDACSSECNLVYDGNGDGLVGSGDLLGLLAEFGTECTPLTGFSCGDPISYHGYDYETVQIGEQCWFAENLRNENYNNGNPIASNLASTEWSSTTLGASTVYGEGSVTCANFATNGDACDEGFSLIEYGRLYNWHAVDSPNGLCPSGWHIPSDSEWMDLEIHLGMSLAEANMTGFRGTNEGTSLKSVDGWWLGGGDNSSGFSARPGGLRGGFGETQFMNGGGGTFFWTSSKNPGELPWYRGLTSVSSSAEQITRNNTAAESTGYSIRCIKD